MIIVTIASEKQTQAENIRTIDLRPHWSGNLNEPYITAYLKADVLPLMFVIGDGNQYDSEAENYLNQPLKNNTKYIAFLRFFENQVRLWKSDARVHL